ncbi:hypothetical protein JXQ70_09870 [bacterium]|nr:hypothetical protein [bacterium]
MKDTVYTRLPEFAQVRGILIARLDEMLCPASGTNMVLVNALRRLWSENTFRLYPFFWFEAASLFIKDREAVFETGFQIDLMSHLWLLRNSVLSEDQSESTEYPLDPRLPELEGALQLLLFDGLLTMFNERIMHCYVQGHPLERCAAFSNQSLIALDWLGLNETASVEKSDKTVTQRYHADMVRLTRNAGHHWLSADRAGIRWYEAALDYLALYLEQVQSGNMTPELSIPMCESLTAHEVEHFWHIMKTYLGWTCQVGFIATAGNWRLIWQNCGSTAV